MEILKRGKKLSKEYVAKCPKCGTKFIYTVDELYGLYDNRLDCTVCEKTIYVEMKIRYHREFHRKLEHWFENMKESIKRINAFLKRSNGD